MFYCAFIIVIVAWILSLFSSWIVGWRMNLPLAWITVPAPSGVLCLYGLLSIILLFSILLNARGSIGFFSLYPPDSRNAPTSIFSYYISFSISSPFPALFPPYGSPLAFYNSMLIDANSLNPSLSGTFMFMFVSVMFCPVLCLVFLFIFRVPAWFMSSVYFCMVYVYDPPLCLRTIVNVSPYA